MEHLERDLKNQMKSDRGVPYPDFEAMWDRIQQNELHAEAEAGGKSWTPVVSQRFHKRAAMILGISAALVAVPVYAAIQYDWSDLLSYRSGIMTALEDGLGQTIEQSVTRNGITLTVHTAFTDENRTVLLYSLDPGPVTEGQSIDYGQLSLRDDKGKLIKGDFNQRYNEQLGVVQGYFESEWVPSGSLSELTFGIEDVHFMEEARFPVSYNPKQSEAQELKIGRDGVESLLIQSFPQSEGEVLLRSVFRFAENFKPEQAGWVRIEIEQKSDQHRTAARNPGIFGTPGKPGEVINEQVFSAEQLQKEDTRFEMVYSRAARTSTGVWGIDLQLSKKQMEKSTFQEKLNVPLPQVPGGTSVHELIITPTQVRVILKHQEKVLHLPYQRFELHAGETVLQGGSSLVDYSKSTELRFEMNGLKADELAGLPMTLVAKHRIDEHEGDGTPILLNRISEQRQSVEVSLGAYPVQFTYYRKDGHLYVESSSQDSRFGGVTQTYYLEEGGKRIYAKPAKTWLRGDGDNRRMDVYENFTAQELPVYVWMYTTEAPKEELSTPLRSGQ
ncbi:hypothetical protein E6C60_0348 [Paenibacillus algicola]|uniref:DUF4179 domain-containing protein n=2 Tax=Paenibacillus algicola TaxID=2565926 RepID=A0A4P8XFC3_9BACL|nr:hypothetical protein E6C60_0348 [Paenibacillus algicola]